jgi:hypothetical protein
MNILVVYGLTAAAVAHVEQGTAFCQVQEGKMGCLERGQDAVGSQRPSLVWRQRSGSQSIFSFPNLFLTIVYKHFLRLVLKYLLVIFFKLTGTSPLLGAYVSMLHVIVAMFATRCCVCIMMRHVVKLPRGRKVIGCDGLPLTRHLCVRSSSVLLE